MDADGMLEVSAIESSSGKAASVTIEASGGLTSAEVENLQTR
jgi:molecular chaperone DnaK (HSP70)